MKEQSHGADISPSTAFILALLVLSMTISLAWHTPPAIIFDAVIDTSDALRIANGIPLCSISAVSQNLSTDFSRWSGSN